VTGRLGVPEVDPNAVLGPHRVVEAPERRVRVGDRGWDIRVPLEIERVCPVDELRVSRQARHECLPDRMPSMEVARQAEAQVQGREVKQRLLER